jgi:hypothetical protein
MSEKRTGRVPGGRYTEEEIERGLEALAVCGGSTRRASRELAARGLEIPHPTLQDWKTLHADRYQRMRDEVVPRIHGKLAEESEDLAREYGEVEREAIAILRERLPELRPHEGGNALRNLATSRAISIDKASVLRGRPTRITEHRSADEILEKWRKLGVIEPNEVVDGTVEEDDLPELPPAA